MPATYADGQLASSTGTLLAASTRSEERVVNVLCVNTSGSSTETVTLTLTRGGSSARLLAKVILAPYEGLYVRGVAMDPSDVLSGFATDASTVDYTVTRGDSAVFDVFSVDANGARKAASSGVSGNQSITGNLTVTGGTVTLSGTTALSILSLTDNLADAFNVKEATNSYLKFTTTNSGETVTVGVNLTMADAKNIVVNATTGTQIATATTQKLAFFGSTPIVQPLGDTDTTTAAAGSVNNVFLNTTITGGGTAAYTVGGLVKKLKALGLLAA